ncbi:MAG TPA: hypothetical protein VHK27_12670 [Gammaproteobacteria bacterium]|nr:hypothetical protein [Gammaproteobacteria bacterium]
MRFIIDMKGPIHNDLKWMADKIGMFDVQEIGQETRASIIIDFTIPTELFHELLNLINDVESYQFDNGSPFVTRIDLDPSIYVVQSEISVLFGVTRSAVSNWTRQRRHADNPFPAPRFGPLWLRSDLIRWSENPDWTLPDNRPHMLDQLLHLVNVTLLARNTADRHPADLVAKLYDTVYHT